MRHFEAVLAIDPRHEQAISSLERLRMSGLRPDCMDNTEYAEYLLATFTGSAAPPHTDSSGKGADDGRSRGELKRKDDGAGDHQVDGMYPQWY